MLIHKVQLDSFLSFGTVELNLDLAPLNVLVGPNGSGKSNLIEAICVMRATSADVQAVIRRGGGTPEWIWKGATGVTAKVALTFRHPTIDESLTHVFAFNTSDQAFHLEEELVVGEQMYLFGSVKGEVFVVRGGKRFRINPDGFDLNASVLTQRKDPERYPEITFLADQYARIRAYREWEFGRNTAAREPQQADVRSDRLEEDFSNLGLFLNKLRRNPQAKKAILTRLRDLYEGVDDFDVSVEGGTVQVFFTEGQFTIPATRLSDGTLRYLCLLAILCDPTPPPLICIEEPELGLHPDILPKIADLLVEASTRTQLIVTTHSDILVDAFTDRPEVIVVCEKHDGQTQMKRLSKEDLAVWLEKYRLGELWMRGQIGGTRW